MRAGWLLAQICARAPPHLAAAPAGSRRWRHPPRQQQPRQVCVEVARRRLLTRCIYPASQVCVCVAAAYRAAERGTVRSCAPRRINRRRGRAGWQWLGTRGRRGVSERSVGGCAASCCLRALPVCHRAVIISISIARGGVVRRVSCPGLSCQFAAGLTGNSPCGAYSCTYEICLEIISGRGARRRGADRQRAAERWPDPTGIVR